MQNPFKVGDVVLTKVKEAEVEAAVTQIWKNEVQVRTSEGLLWRTMFTVWKRGEAPLQREVKTKATSPAATAAPAPKQTVTPSKIRKAAPKKPSKTKRSQRRR